MVILSQASQESQEQTCETVISLNGTHTMRGEQETTWVPHLPDYLYLGGAPRDMLSFTDSDLSIPTQADIARLCIRVPYKRHYFFRAWKPPLIGPFHAWKPHIRELCENISSL